MTKEEVIGIYKRSSLFLSEEEAGPITEDFNRLLDFVSILDTLDAKEIGPLENILDKSCPLRKDRAGESLERDGSLANAENTKYGYFKIDKVID